MKKITVLLSFLLFFIFSPIILAYDINKDDYLYVGGQSIGIKLNCGVTVVGTYGIYYEGNIYKPWEDLLLENDIIKTYNNKDITKTEDLLQAMKSNNGDKSQITIIRNNKEINKEIIPFFDGKSYSLGLYIKDSILGVGTLTYYIEGENIYGALGHQIGNNEFTEGKIFEATIDSIILPSRNQAGEKKATIVGKSIGSINKNTNTGVQGSTNDNFDYSCMEYLQFKTKEEINLGDAYIYTVLNESTIEKFKINITKLLNQDKKDIKGIEFKVTDKELISKTGGIIQGMSGSPIVQDNKLIGAVTHVSLNDSTLGYGIYLEWMFEDMGIKVVE